MEQSAKNAKLKIVYFDVETNEQLSLFLTDLTFVVFDSKDNTLKRISTKIQQTNHITMIYSSVTL